MHKYYHIAMRLFLDKPFFINKLFCIISVGIKYFKNTKPRIILKGSSKKLYILATSNCIIGLREVSAKIFVKLRLTAQYVWSKLTQVCRKVGKSAWILGQ